MSSLTIDIWSIHTVLVNSVRPNSPLQLHPSPKDENRRQILTVDRKAGCLPTFSQLDGDPPPSPPIPVTRVSNDMVGVQI